MGTSILWPRVWQCQVNHSPAYHIPCGHCAFATILSGCRILNGLLCCSVCDLKTRKVVQVLQCSAGPVTACYIDCRSGQLMTACKSGMHFWDVSHLMDRVENVHRNSGMPDNGQVLTECHSPAEDCGPIPSSFSPSTSLKRQKDVVMTAASMPVWRTTSQTGSNFGCDERVQGNANSRRLSISALRTSLCRQELQKKRAQEHASWLRNNLDDLDAMQHELKARPVLLILANVVLSGLCSWVSCTCDLSSVSLALPWFQHYCKGIRVSLDRVLQAISC